MTQRRQWVILGALGALYFLGLGVLVGVVNERFGFEAIALERDRQAGGAPAAMPAPSPKPPAWRIHLADVDAALAGGNVAAAERAWRDAHVDAVRTRAWI